MLEPSVIDTATSFTWPVVAFVGMALAAFYRRRSNEQVVEVTADTKELLSRATMRKDLDELTVLVKTAKLPDMRTEVDELLIFKKRIEDAELKEAGAQEEREKQAKLERERAAMEDSAAGRSGVRTTQPMRSGR